MPRYIGFDPSILASAGQTNTITTFSSNTISNMDSTSIGDGKICIVFSDSATGTDSKAIIASVTQGGTVSYGNAYPHSTTNNASFTSVDYLGNNKVLIAYRDTTDANKGRAVVGTINGTQITYGPIETFETSVTNKEIYVRKATSNSAIMYYGNTTSGVLKIANVAFDDSITFNGAISFGALGQEYNTISRLNSSGTRFLYTGCTGGAISRVININGTTITVGSNKTINSNTTLHTSSIEYEDNKAIVTWCDSTGSVPSYVSKIAVLESLPSGNSITIGPVTNISNDQAFEHDVVMTTANSGFFASAFESTTYRAGVIPFGIDSNDRIYKGNQRFYQKSPGASNISIAKTREGQALFNFGGTSFANSVAVTSDNTTDLKAGDYSGSGSRISSIFSMTDPLYSQYDLRVQNIWPRDDATNSLEENPFADVTYTGIYDILTTSSPGTYTASKTGKHAIIVVSGGGCGAHDNGAGGGGGRIKYGSVQLTSGSPYSYSVGAGGDPNSAGTPAANRDGGTSVFAPGTPYALTAPGAGTGAADGGGGAKNGGDGGSGGGTRGPGGTNGSQGGDFGPNYGPTGTADGGEGQGAYYRRGISFANALLPAPSGHSIANGAGGVYNPAPGAGGAGGGGVVIDGNNISPTSGGPGHQPSGIGYGAGGGGGPGGSANRVGATGANGVILIIG